MQVWNVLHAAHWKYRTQKIWCKKSPSRPQHTTLLGCIFATKACIDNWKKTCYAAMSPPHVLVIWQSSPTNGWDRFGSLGHPYKFQRVSRLGSVTARHSSSGRQPNFVVLNRRPTYIWHGSHHVGYWPTLLCLAVFLESLQIRPMF